MSGSGAQEVWNNAHVKLQHSVHRQKEQADHHHSETPVFHPGDSIWLSTRNLPLHLPCKKLSPQFVGPFKVFQRVNEVTYRLVVSGCLAYAVTMTHLHPPPRHQGEPGIHCQIPTGLLTLWGSAPVSAGLGRVWPRGSVLDSGGGHSVPQHHL
ncbi:uncharacterized protein LOC115206378 [Salmo trutta]|uniref:uncharacterized protein LOC115206378 n=1 Tax=Salmo trutta TaxID=8032 RepID=UPI00113040D2|nr:uncharacterized protein LOC115206378 [Salmo trutta]